MQYNEMKEIAYAANKQLPALGLVLYTWGNVSLIDRDSGIVAIKPSGVEYDSMRSSDIVLVNIDGKRVEGKMNPSSDLATHLVLYRAYPGIGGIVHTHSTHATAWAQARTDIPCLGTTHADYFYGPIPCTRPMRPEEIEENYEEQTGDVIVETLNSRNIDPMQMPGALVSGHGPFTWGEDAAAAVHNAAVLEEIARMALYTRQILGNKPLDPISSSLLDKHFLRKHGANAYYGQKK
jgi:L-ribulose-5-phosphate 4-epimerase